MINHTVLVIRSCRLGPSGVMRLATGGRGASLWRRQRVRGESSRAVSPHLQESWRCSRVHSGKHRDLASLIQTTVVVLCLGQSAPPRQVEGHRKPRLPSAKIDSTRKAHRGSVPMMHRPARSGRDHGRRRGPEAPQPLRLTRCRASGQAL